MRRCGASTRLPHAYRAGAAPEAELAWEERFARLSSLLLARDGAPGELRGCAGLLRRGVAGGEVSDDADVEVRDDEEAEDRGTAGACAAGDAAEADEGTDVLTFPSLRRVCCCRKELREESVPLSLSRSLGGGWPRKAVGLS